MLSQIEVLKPGLFSTIQDMGRYGFLKYGVPRSGVMDSYSAKISNLLLKNSEDAAVMEITQIGPELKFNAAAKIVICGAQLSPRIGEVSVKNNLVHNVNPGEILSFGKPNNGYRAYLAVSGGFYTNEVLGSKSWYEGISPHNRLEKDMILHYKLDNVELKNINAAIKINEELLTSLEVEVLPGPEYKLLSKSQQIKLFSSEFSVDKNASRMAVQLEQLFTNGLKPIITGPVVPGTVQLTSGGRLIVLMRDCQTTGGYPRVLQLTENGINTLAQKIPGEKIYFSLRSQI
jgi:antagonist of KipI